MLETPVILVHLRQPRRNQNESRDDPFWEFGSFGCTGCHGSTLLNPVRIEEIVGARFGFVQGGSDGMRLVHLTPPITIERRDQRCEAKWRPVRMPFRYSHAPLLVRNDGASEFRLLKQFVRGVRRSSWEAKFSSKFRSNRSPLPPGLAREVVKVYETKRALAPRSAIAREYWHALPWAPPVIDQARDRTYANLRGKSPRSSCRTKPCQRERKCR